MGATSTGTGMVRLEAADKACLSAVGFVSACSAVGFDAHVCACRSELLFARELLCRSRSFGVVACFSRFAFLVLPPVLQSGGRASRLIVAVGLCVFHPYRSDGCWWIDAPDGAGVYIQRSSDDLPPSGGKWEPLSAKAASVLPQLRVQQRPNTN